MRALHATQSGAAHTQLATGGRTTVDAAPRTGVDLATLYAAHRLSLVRLAVLLVDELSLAEDVVQDAFVGPHRRSGRLDDPGAALAYLRVSVVNGARSTLRRRGTVRRFLARASAPDEVAAADHEVLLGESRDATLEAVRRLPPRQREVLVLRYWGDLSERQIAEAMGITEGTVKSTASRALDALERLLEEQR
ncbi:MAG: SigE family RNA polymerase sigma factor [Actinomycetota bacterium]|nr:SigE family RNA polymerase sigma factor [Actinomycetota bacterium]